MVWPEGAAQEEDSDRTTLGSGSPGNGETTDTETGQEEVEVSAELEEAPDEADAASASGISGIVSQQSVDSAIVQAAKSLAMAAESMQGAMEKQQRKPGEKLDLPVLTTEDAQSARKVYDFANAVMIRRHSGGATEQYASPLEEQQTAKDIPEFGRG